MFVKRVWIAAPVAVVFGFHERPDALRLLSPTFPPLRVVSSSGGIQTGARIELRVAYFIKWVAVHTGYEKNRLFVDEQSEGPFQHWIHRHEFKAVDQGTLLTDEVDFLLPGGALANRLFSWAVRLQLRGMFAHRHAVTKRMCESQGSSDSSSLNAGK